jgi:magnesium chelatase family protein
LTRTSAHVAGWETRGGRATAPSRWSSATLRASRGRCSTAIDLHVEVPAPSLREPRTGEGESSSEVAPRVAAARERHALRLPGRDLPVDAAMLPADLRRWCALDPAGQRLLDSAFERLGLSRALARVLEVARMIADLAAGDRIGPAHVAEAIQYRSLDRAPAARLALAKR